MSSSTVRAAAARGARRLRAARLNHGHGAPGAAEEALFFIICAAGLPGEMPERFLDMPLTERELALAESFVDERIRTRRPAAYIARRAFLQGLSFYVDERVIVPRSFIAEILPEFDLARPPRRILDLCTGSGCLAILAAHLFPEAQVDAADISKDAADVARRNVADHRLESRVRILTGDLFAPAKGAKYDLILANPPYVSAAAMKRLPPEYRHEPKLALAAPGPAGLGVVSRILDGATRHLSPGGGLLCEIGTGRRALEKAFPRLPFLWLETELGSGEVFWLDRQSFT